MLIAMSRHRLLPTGAQEAVLLTHCAHARFVWNLAVEQHAHWRPGRLSAPGYNEQARQLTEARAEFAWLRAGSVTVQQQALRDFHQALANFYAGTHRRPMWRKAGRNEGFRQVGVRPEHVQKLNRRLGQVSVPKIGWVRFRRSRNVPDSVSSYRVTKDVSGRWHIAFAAKPDPIPSPGNGRVVGVDRGVMVSAALSTGEMLRCPGSTIGEERRLRALQRRLTRSAKGTADRPGSKVRQKAGLNRGILAHRWGMLVARLAEKAVGRVEKVKAGYTSQQCSDCGHVASESRKSQAVFRCVSCGFSCNADVNAACNIAAGRAVTARGDLAVGRSANREPQLATSTA
ncbi:RNA-guided endonuclease InsQ/TnpB family protein [Saccharopolyspora hattusasensis]|uniref:RNA-guided endonuclease InsQ/TnpB family protein n=1 Tax=Saccharopolyspora hattusasensis TaxID=1128679 RepID=UPI003D971633